MTIKNGMTVRFNKNTPASRLHLLNISISKIKQIYDLQIELKGDGGSKILDDGQVMVKGIANFPAEIFEEVPESEVGPETEDDQGLYCVIIMTKECEGDYMHYDDVVEHELDVLGVYIKTSNGDEHFHPWSYEGGIERITKTDSYEF